MVDAKIQPVLRHVCLANVGIEIDRPAMPNPSRYPAQSFRQHSSPAAGRLRPSQGPVDGFPRKRMVRSQPIKRRLPIPVRQAVQ
jgi:hypothetical protein